MLKNLPCFRLLLFLFHLTGFQLSAQNFSARLMLGINGSQIDGDGMSGYYKPGLAAGAGVRFPLTEKISFGPEFLYSMKGSKASFEQVTEFGFPRIIYRLNYLDLPIVADYRISGGLEAEAGLSFGRLLNARLDNGTNLGFVDVPYLFRKSDFQVLIGLKYKIFDDTWLSGRFMYSLVSTNALGLSNINYGLAGLPGRGGFFNNILQITISRQFYSNPLEKISEVSSDSKP